MKKYLSLLLILSLLTVSLTACGGNKASASGNSATANQSIETSQAEEPETVIPEEEVEEDMTEVAESEEPEIENNAEDEVDSTDYPVGDPNNPSAVDPAPFWHGDDFFDIMAYFKACGASNCTWYQDFSGNEIVVVGIRCIFSDRKIIVNGINAKAFNIILIEVGQDDVFISHDSDPFRAIEPIFVDSKHAVQIDRKTIDEVIAIVESGSLFYGECPFSGSNVDHSKVDGSNTGPHND